MATIRKARPEDLKQVEYVCRMTAGPGSRRDPEVGNRVAKMYSTYYIRECVDNCFVLADDDDTVVGYVLCEPNFKRFRKVYRKVDVKHIYSLHKQSGKLAWHLPIPYTVFGGKYPAHLHIDLMPDFQGAGYGTKMMEMLLEHLKSIGVKGVMLTTDEDNYGAIRFYERLGFKTLLCKFKFCAMGKQLN